jgi:ubiquinone/menaquinone biosynthesis C-methylase UbiE
LARKRALALGFDVEFIGLPSEKIPLDTDSVDTVLVTYSLCTIPDPVSALRVMARVLRPNGRLLFCEHGMAPDANIKKWQDRANPLWRKLAGGCNLNRDIPRLLQTVGFTVTELESSYLPGTPKIAGYNYWGHARMG